MQPRQQMCRTDEAPEQPMPVDPPRKAADPPPPDEIPPFPVAPGRIVQHRRDEGAISRHILLAVRPGEEAMERLMVGQRLRGRQFQPVERDMRGVEVDRSDPRGIGRQIAQDIATTRSDGNDMAFRSDRQRVHVDLRIFPYLRIDKAPEGEGKGPLQQPLP